MKILKKKRDKIREKAERTANKLDVIEWRKASAQNEPRNSIFQVTELPITKTL